MSLGSSLQLLFNSKKPVTASMAYYDPVMGLEINGTHQAFQYFPEKIQDSKGVEYASRSVPGASHPIYSFIAGGERSISFDAVFCNDKGEASAIELLTGKSFKVTEDKSRQDVVDIPAAIAWIRTCLYPSYEKNIAKPPPLVVIYLPKSGIIGAGNIKDSVVGILTKGDVTYEAFHRDGTPRISVVSIEIKEVVQTNPQWQYFDGNILKTAGSKYKRALNK